MPARLKTAATTMQSYIETLKKSDFYDEWSKARIPDTRSTNNSHRVYQLTKTQLNKLMALYEAKNQQNRSKI